MLFKTISFIFSFLFTFLSGVILYDTHHIQTTTYKLKSKEIIKKLKICVLSDLHGGVFEGDGLYKAVKQSSPDIVIMAGDMANAKFSFSDASAIDLVRRLSKDYPVYYGIGNHEARLSWSPHRFDVSYKDLMTRLKKNGAIVLDNESLYLEDYGVTLTGLNLSEDYYRKGFIKKTNDNSLSEFIDDKKPGYEILIAHNPEYFMDYVKRGSNLVFSGHLHGGIMRLPFHFGAVSPRYVLFPRFAYGLYRKKRTNMIVSGGLGQHTIPVRVFNTAELVYVELDADK